MLTGKKYWDSIATGYSKTSGSKWVRHPWTIALAGNVKGKKILELGCGTGVIINALVHKGAIGTGIDYSDEMLREAARLASDRKLKTRFLKADIRDLHSLYTESFDCIIISAVLITVYSITMITEILTEATKVLSPTGTILIAEPHPFFDHYMRRFFKNPNNIRSIDYLAKGKKYAFEMNDGNNIPQTSFIYHWRLEDYSKAIESSGLCIYRVREPKPIPDAKSDPSWYQKRSRFPAYIFLEAGRRQAI